MSCRKFYFRMGLLICAFIQAPAALARNPHEDVAAIQQKWDQAYFGAHNHKETLVLLKDAELAANAATKSNPGAAAPLAWLGIVLATEAGETGDAGALSLARAAKECMEKAAALDPDSLSDGSTYTILGALYYQTPGFPIGFGDKAKARRYLKMGLDQNPTGLDANFFYADFLFEEGKYEDAARFLVAALNAPARPGRQIADQGRRDEALQLLARTRQKLAKG